MKTYDKYNKYIKQLSSIFEKLAEVEEGMEEDIKHLSDYDRELSDYMHIIESEDLENIKNLKSLFRKIKVARMKRREVKVIFNVFNRYQQCKTKLIEKSNRQMLLADLNKEVTKATQEYKFKVIDKEDIL